jgi:hypothetical protein
MDRNNAMLRFVLFLLLSYLPVSLARSPAQQLLGGVPFIFREAKIEDAADFTDVFIDAFSTASDWSYIHQFEDEYPGYRWRCVHEAMKELIGGNSTTIVLRVIAVPDPTAQSGSRVVSLSAWDFNKTSSNIIMLQPSVLADQSNCSQQLDINQTRLDHKQKYMREAEKVYLDDVYPRQVYLGGLATHPKWDGNGFAKVHLDWGMALADKIGLPTTLLASPAGYPLYTSVGFESLHNATIERLDGKGTIWFEVMKYSP